MGGEFAARRQSSLVGLTQISSGTPSHGASDTRATVSAIAGCAKSISNVMPASIGCHVRQRVGLGTAMALLGGAIAAPITTVEFRTGVDILPVSFMAVVVGGLGNLKGTVPAAG